MKYLFVGLLVCSISFTCFAFPYGIEEFWNRVNEIIRTGKGQSSAIISQTNNNINSNSQSGSYHQSVGSKCSCVNKDCSCCFKIQVPTLNLNDNACANTTRLTNTDYQLSVTINGKLYYQNRLPIGKNLPTTCFNVPNKANGAKLCLSTYQNNNNKDSNCVDLTAFLPNGNKVADMKVGCFNFGSGNSISSSGSSSSSSSFSSSFSEHKQT